MAIGNSYKKYLLITTMLSILLVVINACTLTAQNNQSNNTSITFSGFLDVFYVYDMNKPGGNTRQEFLYNHNRHNEFNINLGLIKLSVDHKKYRTNIAFHTGTYATDNYSAEPDLLKHIFEANVGISLNKNNNLWIDAGVLPSHIGFESAISIDNKTLTRSLLAENSPYFLTGAKLSYLPNTEWEIAALVVNGWQRIQRLEGNSLPSFGTHINYHPNRQTTVNWSTFIGTDDPDQRRRMRFFNNLYTQLRLSSRWSLTSGFDLGAQQIRRGSSDYHIWFSPVLIAQLAISEKWQAAVRAEYYYDKEGVIIPTGTRNGFQTTGLSLGFDYKSMPDITWRIEGRMLQSREPIFKRLNDNINNNMFLTTSLAVRFNEKLKK